MADDRDLEAAFGALRASDAVRRPSLRALLGRRVPAPRRIAPRAAALALAALVAGGAWIGRNRAARPGPGDVCAWRSPTQALLAPAPGASAIPRLGETWGASALQDLEEPK